MNTQNIETSKSGHVLSCLQNATPPVPPVTSSPREPDSSGTITPLAPPENRAVPLNESVLGNENNSENGKSETLEKLHFQSSAPRTAQRKKPHQTPARPREIEGFVRAPGRIQ